MRPENHFWVKWHLQKNLNNNRKHIETNNNDMVRFKLKPSIGTKGHEPKWSSARHDVVGSPTDNQYYIPSLAVEYRNSQVCMKHELLNV